MQSAAVSLPTEDDRWTSGGGGSATRGRTPREPILIGGVPAVGPQSALGGNVAGGAPAFLRSRRQYRGRQPRKLYTGVGGCTRSALSRNSGSGPGAHRAPAELSAICKHEIQKSGKWKRTREKKQENVEIDKKGKRLWGKEPGPERHLSFEETSTTGHGAARSLHRSCDSR